MRGATVLIAALFLFVGIALGWMAAVINYSEPPITVNINLPADDPTRDELLDEIAERLRNDSQ